MLASFIAFLNFSAQVGSIATGFVAVYCCCHDTRANKCFPCQCRDNCTCVGGAFCTRNEDLLDSLEK